MLNWAELFAFYFLDEENGMKNPQPHEVCQHGVLQSKCDKRPKSAEYVDACQDVAKLCKTEDDFKYKIVRVSVEEVDVSLVETSCCCNVKVNSIKSTSHHMFAPYHFPASA